MAIDDVARRALKMYASQVREAYDRIRALEKRIEALEAKYDASEDTSDWDAQSRREV